MNKTVHVECLYCGHTYKYDLPYYQSPDLIRCSKCGDKNVKLTELKDIFGYGGK